jgi:hypothetical protein
MQTVKAPFLAMELETAVEEPATEEPATEEPAEDEPLVFPQLAKTTGARTRNANANFFFIVFRISFLGQCPIYIPVLPA